MAEKKHKLHDGQKGSALAIRVIPHANQNQVAKILKDGTIQVRIIESATDRQINNGLIRFLSEILGVPRSKIEIVAGHSGRDKLVSVVDMDAETVHQRIVNHRKD